MTPRHQPRAFVLLEAMIAVAIFSLAVVGLGKCVDNCIRAQRLIQDEARAIRALENRMAEIEAGAVPFDDKVHTDELEGAFKGLTMRQQRKVLDWKNEKDEEITGIFTASLEVSWNARGDRHSRVLEFYVMPAR